MKKIISLFVAFFFISCSNSCYLSEKEAFCYLKPMIEAIIKYKEENKKYPKNLLDIKNFPYKIKKYPNQMAYYFLDKKGLYLKAINLEEVKPKDSVKFYLKVDFLKCTSSKSVHSAKIDFMQDNSFNIHYFKISPAGKQ